MTEKSINAGIFTASDLRRIKIALDSYADDAPTDAERKTRLRLRNRFNALQQEVK